MFLTGIFKWMETQNVSFGWRKTLNRILILPTKTREDRFRFLLNLVSISPSIWLTKMEDPEGSDREFNGLKLYKILSEASTFSNTEMIVRQKLMEAISYMAEEFINEDGVYGDFDKISDIFIHKIWVQQFLEVKSKVNALSTKFVFKAKSGTVYSGENLAEINKLNTEQLLDIVSWIDHSEESRDANANSERIRKYILENETIIKERFKQHRIGLIGFINFVVLPLRRNEVVIFVSEKLWIPHGFDPRKIEIKIKK